MSFGSWVKQIRHKRDNWDTRLVARMARLNQSTLSRVENDTLSPTLETVVKILRALELTKLEFLQIVTDSPNPEIWRIFSDKVTPKIGPTAKEVASFSQMNLMTNSVQVFLARWLNKIDQRNSREDKIPEKGDRFRVIDIDPFIFGPSFYLYQMEYPHPIKTTILLENYWTGGIVIPEDVITYIQGLFRHCNPLPSKTDVLLPQAVIYQVEDPYSFRKMKLADLVKLDNLYGGNGGITVLGVKAAEDIMSRMLGDFKHAQLRTSRRPRLPKDNELAYTFIFMSRWVQHLGLSITEWLQEACEARREDGIRKEPTMNSDMEETLRFFGIKRGIGEY